MFEGIGSNWKDVGAVWGRRPPPGLEGSVLQNGKCQEIGTKPNELFSGFESCEVSGSAGWD